MNNFEFFSGERTLMIAPAGYGKTHLIAAAIIENPTEKPHLVLTHTHAGIASIRAKCSKLGGDPKLYKIETISGFAQRFVLAFTKRDNLPSLSNDVYFDSIVKRALELFTIKSVRNIIRDSYSDIWVDEYQDCSWMQHKMIMEMGQSLPIHIFGDPLQQIYTFSGTSVDFDKDLAGFSKSELHTPMRWQIPGHSKELGEYILNIREMLNNKEDIDLRSESCEQVQIEEIQDGLLPRGKSIYKFRKILSALEENSVLVIIPAYSDRRKGNFSGRVNFKRQFDFKNEYFPIEAIDSKIYYRAAKCLDEFLLSLPNINIYSQLHELLITLSFNKTHINEWINKGRNSLVVKAKDVDEYNRLRQTLSSLQSEPSYANLQKVIEFFADKCGCSHEYLLKTIHKCFKICEEGKTMYDCMCYIKNKVRMCGRKVDGKCIGTTLLTKGLEFDTVVIVDADNIQDAKNFYVAISRACKKLIIFTQKTVLHFK